MDVVVPTSIADFLQEARTLGVERLDAQMLLERTLARPRTWLLAHDEQPLPAAALETLRALLTRRAAGEPVAYILGEKEFHGLLLNVDTRVLVPRPETELLVDWALELLAGDERAGKERPGVVDLGTGSGAIALAVKHRHPAADVLATDVSEGALSVACANARRLGLDVAFAHGAWWQAAGQRRFQLALSNPPYIAQADAHLAALVHEPALALTPGGDGLASLREIVAGAAAHLAPGAWLLLEHGFDQAEAVRNLLRAHGFGGVESRHDLAGHLRCSGAHKP